MKKSISIFLLLILSNSIIFSMKRINDYGRQEVVINIDELSLQKSTDIEALKLSKQFFDGKTLNIARKVNSEIRENIDGFIAKECLSDVIKKKDIALFSKEVCKLLENIELRLRNKENRCDSVPFLYISMSKKVEKIVFLNKNNFREKLFEILKKAIGFEYKDLRKKRHIVEKYSFYSLILTNLFIITGQIDKRFGFFGGTVGSVSDVSMFVVIFSKILEWNLKKAISKDEIEINKMKKKLKRIFCKHYENYVIKVM